jgi:hypothetical protein
VRRDCRLRRSREAEVKVKVEIEKRRGTAEWGISGDRFDVKPCVN